MPLGGDSAPTFPAPPRRTTVRRVSLDLREQDPRGARFDAIAQSVLFALVGCIVGLVAAGLLVGMSEPAGWLIIAAGISTGIVPVARWLRDRRTIDHLDLYDIDRSLRPLLLRAASAADRIERAATTAPSGPVGELLDENHRSALAHVKLLEHDARSGGVTCRPEILGVCHQLDELAATSEQLLHTALEAQPTVLNALTEHTALVNETLALGAQLDQEAVDGSSEELDGRDREDRDATNGH